MRRSTTYPLPLAVVAALVLNATSPPAFAAASVHAAPYRDRIISREDLQVLPPDEDEEYDDEGLPRSVRAELNLSHSERGEGTFTEQGLSVGGFWETPSLGSFSLDATLFRSNRDRFRGDGGLGGAITLWQRDLNLDGGWLGSNGLGVLNTPLTPLQYNQYRFFMPTVALAGAATEWRNEGSGLLLQASLGRAGIYNGTRMVGFDIADGDVASLGAQWSWAPQWKGSAMFLGTQGRIVPDALEEAVFAVGDTRAMYAGTSWDGARDAMQFNLLSSNGDRGHASGAWVDASSRRGRYTHNYGVFRLDPGLSWGALPINNDAEGGYYRVGYQYARWSWNGGVDTIRSISGDGFDGVYATAFGRYQASSTLGYGASFNTRHASGDDGGSYSTQWFADKRNAWGQTRVQLDLATAGNHADSWQVSVDQSFAVKQARRLSASLSHGSLVYDGEAATRSTSLTLYGGGDLTNTLSLDGSARWTEGDGPSAQRGSDFNIGLNWRLQPHWALSAMVYQSEGSQRSPFVLDPLVTGTPFISLPRDRSLFLTLRYDRQAGRQQGVLGGAPGGAVGSISGSLFLDENDDGQRAASEQPAANITVILDGRYSVRTDSLGNFSFPRVAAGPHLVTAVPDNLPLPWFIDEAPGQAVQVNVRQDAHLQIGARRRR
ncbi:carboxypeptidase regulatory-like domain-containing protein [Pseudoxanthomonas gei]|uniref:Carboxypeptidase regulatory-like domain-containing protein n=1 Tax=Pseudoxanthomonas gei TaxID=1383030 RepID=A0ABX0AE41_9GAMM|nr:carboxypeptidase-like regulatory domain-containing protein [Pseudoxanthomonas gei]NDK39696.1 carboxypeptidase regulatory-like domain-containing protein [Pseudoxanthomonas gei]